MRTLAYNFEILWPSHRLSLSTLVTLNSHTNSHLQFWNPLTPAQILAPTPGTLNSHANSHLQFQDLLIPTQTFTTTLETLNFHTDSRLQFWDLLTSVWIMAPIPRTLNFHANFHMHFHGLPPIIPRPFDSRIDSLACTYRTLRLSHELSLSLSGPSTPTSHMPFDYCTNSSSHTSLLNYF